MEPATAALILNNKDGDGEIWAETTSPLSVHSGNKWKAHLKFKGEKGIDFRVGNTLVIVHYCGQRQEWVILIKD